MTLCTDLLLAGGASSRMGRDKALLPIGGQPMWRRQVQALQAAGAEIIHISGRARCAFAGFPVIPDAQPNCGPLGGLAAALAQAKTPWIRVLAVDLPAMTSGFLRELLAAAQARKLGAIPWDGKRFHPLAAVYPQAAGEVARRRLAAHQLSLQDWVRELIALGLAEPWSIPENQRRCLFNLNTPEEWREFQASLR